MNLVSTGFIANKMPNASSDRVLEIQSRVSKVIEEYLNTNLDVTTYIDEIYDSKTVMILNHMPIVSVESIIDLRADNNLLVEGTDYYVYPGQISIPNRYSAKKDLKISYTAGLQTIPQDVYIVAEELVSYWAFKEDRQEELFYETEAMEDRSYKSRKLSEETILSKLSKYRQPYGPSRVSRQKIYIGVI